MNDSQTTSAQPADLSEGEITYHRLQRGDALPYAAMTYPSFQNLMDVDEHACAIGVKKAGRVCGMALGYFPPDQEPDVSHLLSLFVDPADRGHGLGHGLLQRFEDMLREEGKHCVRATYMTGKPGIEAFERVLQKCQWDEPVTRMVVVKSTIPIIKNAPWMKLTELPAGMDMVAWTDVTEAERAEIRRSHEEKPWIAEDLVPFDHEENFDPCTSVALRQDGKVVGWVINHQMSRLLIRFTCSFVRKDLQRLGRIVWLYVESVRRMEVHGFFEGMWTVPLKHPRTVAFTRRWMAPYSSFFGETRGVEKRW
ncbi:MAG: GNAT family N-acetyltransferase [Chthoniobacter sp.]|uniref:GNAT family N-acetyltransferase n=1 Tax=Chthoniobacter sp. TaxID=2510640 RepID=UPI0032A42C6D